MIAGLLDSVSDGTYYFHFLAHCYKNCDSSKVAVIAYWSWCIGFSVLTWPQHKHLTTFLLYLIIKHFTHICTKQVTSCCRKVAVKDWIYEIFCTFPFHIFIFWVYYQPTWPAPCWLDCSVGGRPLHWWWAVWSWITVMVFKAFPFM